MSLFRKLVSALKAGSVSKEDWEVIRQQLIATDLGVNLVDQVIEKSKSIKSDNAVDIISTQVQSWLKTQLKQY
jgi:signal recognition particle GTPase